MKVKTRVYTVDGVRFTINGKYSPISCIGKGAYGVVCSAVNTETQARVAIKKIAPALISRCESKHALRELRLLRCLRHPNIVSFEDAFLCRVLGNDELYLVTKLMDSDLGNILASSQPLVDFQIKYLMYQLLRGLSFMHRLGVVHRDLKPANLLVTYACDLRIADLGLARRMPAGGGAMSDHVVTRWYRPPEIMLSPTGEYTTAIDVWSAGCIFAEMFRRKPLFPGKNFLESLKMQFQVLGTPRPVDELAFIQSDKALEFIQALPPSPRVPWTAVAPDASSEACSLLGALLTFDASKRITAADAMRHPYFDDVRARFGGENEDTALFASARSCGAGAIDCAFEAASLTTADYRSLILADLAEMAAIRARGGAVPELQPTLGGPGGSGGSYGGHGGLGGFGGKEAESSSDDLDFLL